MAIKWQEKSDYWVGVTEAPYPRFEAWQSNDAADNSWCLKIFRGTDLAPVEISEIQDTRALAAFARGFLEERNNSNVHSVECHPQGRMRKSPLNTCPVSAGAVTSLDSDRKG